MDINDEYSVPNSRNQLILMILSFNFSLISSTQKWQDGKEVLWPMQTELWWAGQSWDSYQYTTILYGYVDYPQENIG